MDIAEYQNIYTHEMTHFVYVATHEIILDFLKTFLPKLAGRRLKLLDAGCGTGGLIKKLESFGTVWGLDISPRALTLAKKRGIKHLTRGSVTKLPFRANTFDALVCVDVLYDAGIEDDTIALKEFFRVLKPGGILVLKVPALNWLRRHHDIMAHTRHRYTSSEVNNKLRRSGFRILRTTYAFFFLLPALVIKVLVGEKLLGFYTRSDIIHLAHWFNALCLVVLRVEKAIIQKISLPLGISVFSIAKKT